MDRSDSCDTLDVPDLGLDLLAYLTLSWKRYPGSDWRFVSGSYSRYPSTTSNRSMVDECTRFKNIPSPIHNTV